MIWESRLWRPRSLISKINWGALAFIHISSVHFHMLKTHYFALLYFANYHKNLFFFVFVNIYIINHYVSDMVTLAASHPLGMTRSTRTKSVRKTRNYTSKILLKNHTPAIIHLAGFDACHMWHKSASGTTVDATIRYIVYHNTCNATILYILSNNSWFQNQPITST